jgi:hypothetical protein
MEPALKKKKKKKKKKRENQRCMVGMVRQGKEAKSRRPQAESCP